jgi:hypothetical protein
MLTPHCPGFTCAPRTVGSDVNEQAHRLVAVHASASGTHVSNSGLFDTTSVSTLPCTRQAAGSSSRPTDARPHLSASRPAHHVRPRRASTNWQARENATRRETNWSRVPQPSRQLIVIFGASRRHAGRLQPLRSPCDAPRLIPSCRCCWRPTSLSPAGTHLKVRVAALLSCR